MNVCLMQFVRLESAENISALMLERRSVTSLTTQEHVFQLSSHLMTKYASWRLQEHRWEQSDKRRKMVYVSTKTTQGDWMERLKIQCVATLLLLQLFARLVTARKSLRMSETW